MTVKDWVKPGQVFLPCRRYNWDPLATLIIESLSRADGKAYAVSPFSRGGGVSGKHMWVSLKSLHETNKTTVGRPRLTGYFLFTEAPEEPGQWLCGGCLKYFPESGLATVAYGPAASTCRGCKVAIEAQYGGES